MEGCHGIIFISQNRNPKFPQTLATTINLHGSRCRFPPPSGFQSPPEPGTNHRHAQHHVHGNNTSHHPLQQLHCTTIAARSAPSRSRNTNRSTTPTNTTAVAIAACACHHLRTCRKTRSTCSSGECSSCHDNTITATIDLLHLLCSEPWAAIAEAARHRSFLLHPCTSFTATGSSSSSRTTMAASSRPVAPPQRTTVDEPTPAAEEQPSLPSPSPLHLQKP